MQKALRIVSFFGPPGSGKGTLAQRCRYELGAEVLSTGDLCRKHVAMHTALGEMINGYISAGKLVPDDVITEMVKEWILERISGHALLILDGYPRTDVQARYLEEFLSATLPDIGYDVLFFDLSNEVIITRLSSRLVCSNKECQAIYSLLSKKPAQEGVCDQCNAPLMRRKDDDPQVIKQRLESYGLTKDALLAYYKESGTSMYTIEVGALDKDQVFAWFMQNYFEKSGMRVVRP